MSDKRRVPQHLIAAVKSGKRRNAKIRQTIKSLTQERVTDLSLIYARLTDIVDETHESDKDWDRIETGTREAVRAWNAQ